MFMNVMREYQHFYRTNYSSICKSNLCGRDVVCMLRSTKAGRVVKGELLLLLLLLLLLALQPTMGFGLLIDSPPFCPFLTQLSPPSYS